MTESTPAKGVEKAIKSGYMQHFAEPIANTDLFLLSHIEHLHPSSTVIITQDPFFQLLSYEQAVNKHANKAAPASTASDGAAGVAAAAGVGATIGLSYMVSVDLDHPGPEDYDDDGEEVEEDEDDDSLPPPTTDKVLKVVKRAEGVEKIVFAPPRKRRDGKGQIGVQIRLATFDVTYGDVNLIIVFAVWKESRGENTYQWHLVAADQEAATTARQLIEDCCAWSAGTKNTVLVFDQGMWRQDRNLYRAVKKASWDDVILDEEFKARLQEDYRSFFNSEATYKMYGVPWKRGLILLGPPGNGKTITLKAIMNELDVPALYVKSFHSHGGDEFGIRQVFARARAEAPCILILEDLDSLITDYNRSFFLNEVDGLEDNDGLLLIGTTNHFEKLDPALSSRPSRFDRKYPFPNPSNDERRQYATYWQQKLRDHEHIQFPDLLLDQFAEQTDGFSFGYLKESFVYALLVLANEKAAPASISTGCSTKSLAEVLTDQIKYLRDQLNNGIAEAAKPRKSRRRKSHSGSDSDASCPPPMPAPPMWMPNALQW